MQFENTPDLYVDGACLQGYLPAGYHDLVRVFGEPTYNETSGDGKVDIEWNLEFADGTVATIYNWKDFDGGQSAREAISYEWHIGGHDKQSLYYVWDAWSQR